MHNLENELEIYRENLPTMLLEGGKFALIHGNDVAGILGTYVDALNEGNRIFKLEPFLVKEIKAIEQSALYLFSGRVINAPLHSPLPNRFMPTHRRSHLESARRV